ncbi:MAG: hypothetical protein R3Y12_09190 [Clostridia bacterium]
MLYFLSFINLIKNIIVKLWSYKIVRIVVWGYLAYYLISGFGTKVMSRMNSTNFDFPGWSALMPNSNIGFNPNFIKSNKANFSIINSITMLFSIFAPGALFVAIILYVQKVINTFKAPPLPIVFAHEDAEDVLVSDYRLPELYTKDEAEYDDDDEDEDED